MILLKANAELSKVFQYLAESMEPKVEWNGTFVVLYNNLILPGRVRSLFFGFDSKKMYTNVVELPVNWEEAQEVEGNERLCNILNMTLYVFGKWGLLNKLKVDKSYGQLNGMFRAVLKELEVEPEYREQDFRFFQQGTPVTYEDVIQLALEYQEQPEEEQEEEEQKEGGLGLWHSVKWGIRQQSFNRGVKTAEDMRHSRMGHNFYLVDYICPQCGKKLFMALYPVGKEQRIETEEGGVYLARVYSCSSCHLYYTPRPGRLLKEGDIYQLDFEDDVSAYDDYQELLGKNGTRACNFKFNEYESDRNKHNDQPETLEEICRSLEGETEQELDLLLERMEDGFFPAQEVEKYRTRVTSYRNRARKEARQGKSTPSEAPKEADEKVDVRQAQDAKAGNTISWDHTPMHQGESSREGSRQEKSTGKKQEPGESSSPSKPVVQKKREVQVEKLNRRTSIEWEEAPDTGAGTSRQGKHGRRTGAIAKERQYAREAGQPGENLLREQVPGGSISHGTWPKEEAPGGKSRPETSAGGLKSWPRDKEALKDVTEEATSNIMEWQEDSQAGIGPPPLQERIHRERETEQEEKAGYASGEWLEEAGETFWKVSGRRALGNEVRERTQENMAARKDERSDMEQKAEIVSLVKRADKKSRDGLWELFQSLEDKGYREENVKPYLDKIHEKLVQIDREAIKSILPPDRELSFEEGEKAYQEISGKPFLPELKLNMMEILNKRLSGIKQEEQHQLIQKLRRNMGEAMAPVSSIHFCQEEFQSPGEREIIETALRVYAWDRGNYEYPIIVCDGSSRQPGKNGMVLTPDHIFYSGMLQTGTLDISSVESISGKTGLLNKGVYVKCKNMDRLKLPLNLEGSTAKEFSKVMADFVEYLQEKPQSRNIGYLARERHEKICCYRCGYVYSGGTVCPKCGSKINY